MAKYVTDRYLSERYGVARCTIWRWSKNGTLPKPLRLANNCTRWSLDLIEQRDAAIEKKECAKLLCAKLLASSGY